MPTAVRDDADESRYEITVDGEVAGFVEYHLHDDVIAFLHTEVDRQHQGEGLAKALIREVLDDARKRGLKVQPFCPFVRRFIGQNRDYLDLVPQDEWVRFGLTF
ncbi:MAG TPA: GNAT family N-acetyltransferase [Jatrophihabitantaceae bacterium]|nr:GNAT family N-acetyltransferase [Jatrophihabitantaceae bacterium]